MGVIWDILGVLCVPGVTRRLIGLYGMRRIRRRMLGLGRGGLVMLLMNDA